MSEKTTTTGTLDIGAVLSAARMKRELSIATAATTGKQQGQYRTTHHFD